jgi:hypothetical protein
MNTLTITLSNDSMMKLKEKATHFSVLPEELVRLSVEELLTQPDETFQFAMEYVLKKNAELYRRLA